MFKTIDHNEIVFLSKYETKKCDNYLYGSCHIFALALKQYFDNDVDIVLLWQYENEDCSDFGFLAHAFVSTNDNLYFDCRGLVDLDTIIKEYTIDKKNAIIIENDTETILNTLMQEHILDKPSFTEIDSLIDFIDENIFNFTFY